VATLNFVHPKETKDFQCFIGFETILFREATPFSYQSKSELIVIKIKPGELKFQTREGLIPLLKDLYMDFLSGIGAQRLEQKKIPADGSVKVDKKGATAMELTLKQTGTKQI
jgi:hypothetical protein